MPDWPEREHAKACYIWRHSNDQFDGRLKNMILSGSCDEYSTELQVSFC